MCAWVTGYYKQEFLKGVAQGGAGGGIAAPADDATSSQSWEIHVTEDLLSA
jgi:hypothetical protein